MKSETPKKSRDGSQKHSGAKEIKLAQGNEAKAVHNKQSDKQASSRTVEQDKIGAGDAVAAQEQAAMKAPKVSFSQWLRSRWYLDEELPENEYYLRIALRYRLLKYAAIALTVALLLGMTAVYSEDITVENFRYLLRDLDSGSTKYTGVYEKIQYDGSTDLKFALYKGDLVVVRSGKTSIFGMDAATVMNNKNDFYNPVLLSGGKYFLVYDPGQTSYSCTLYNAFSPLYTMRMESPIYDGAISDKGIFALVTETKGYRGVVEVYDEDFDLMTTVSKDKFIWDVALSKDGEQLLILSASTSDGVWYTEVHLVNSRTSETLMQFTLSEMLAYACHFTSNGSFCLLTEDDMRFYVDGNLKSNTVSFGGAVPVDWCFGDEYQAVAFNRTILGQDRIVRIIKAGAQVCQFQISGQIVSSVFDGKDYYILTDTAVYRIDCEALQFTQYAVGGGCRELLSIDETHLLLCFGNYAITVNPETDFSEWDVIKP